MALPMLGVRKCRFRQFGGGAGNDLNCLEIIVAELNARQCRLEAFFVMLYILIDLHVPSWLVSRVASWFSTFPTCAFIAK